ncbi:MAG TPA: SDR family oxidoreductase [Polyangiaceae bacterium]|nr:SDR family oxidoreductase [Polyangiaceae bacterium]
MFGGTAGTGALRVKHDPRQRDRRSPSQQPRLPRILTEKSDAQIPATQKAQLIDSHPIRRLGVPEDVAEAALYLASESAGWVSGVVLDVAGGSVLAR